MNNVLNVKQAEVEARLAGLGVKLGDLVERFPFLMALKYRMSCSIMQAW